MCGFQLFPQSAGSLWHSVSFAVNERHRRHCGHNRIFTNSRFEAHADTYLAQAADPVLRHNLRPESKHGGRGSSPPILMCPVSSVVGQGTSDTLLAGCRDLLGVMCTPARCDKGVGFSLFRTYSEVFCLQTLERS